MPEQGDTWPITEPPTEAEVGRIRRHAVASGGAALQLPHGVREVAYRPSPSIPYERRVAMAYCDRVAQFTVPIPEQPWQRLTGVVAKAREQLTDVQKQANGTRFCAEDDAAHLWPRFQ